MADRKLEALSRVPLFSRCSPKELQFIAREGDEVDVPAGKTLIRQGKPGDTFYIQLEGQS
ncbi:MAG: cyclic nucleotide-binding domain-containing protein, partial [Chloroflexi bacterium]